MVRSNWELPPGRALALSLCALSALGCPRVTLHDGSHGSAQMIDAGSGDAPGVRDALSPPLDAPAARDARVATPDAPAVPAAVTILATGESGPCGLSLDAEHVYWARYGGADYAFMPRIRRLPKGGGAIQDVAVPVDAPVALALCGDEAFYVTQVPGQGGGGAAWAVPKDGSAEPRRLLGDLNFVWAVACDSTHVWVGTDGAVTRVPRAGGAATVFGGLAGVMALTADEAGVYIGSNTGLDGRSTVRTITRGGTTVQTLATGLYSVRHLALDDAGVYVVDSVSPPGSVARYDRATGTRLEYYYGPDPMGVARFDGHVYWTLGVGGVYRAPSVGGAPQLLAQDSPGGASIEEVEADADRVYWANPGTSRLASAPLPP